MSSIANSVITEQDRDGMLRRALERIIQLYTDKSHFVYELLQNAEDAEAKSIKFLQFSDRLEVFHDGKPFTSANLKGLCDIGKSDKADNYNQIGEFGVGFKSVFGICDIVKLYSNPSNYAGKMTEKAIPFAVEICDFTQPRDIEEEQLPSNYTTRFVFPYTVGQSFSGFSSIDTLVNTLASKLQNLGITTLLFMKNLELIEYKIDIGGEPITGEYLLDKKIINDHYQMVSAIGVSEKEKTDADRTEEISYLKFSRQLKEYPQRTVDIAFPVKIYEDGRYRCLKAINPYVSVYFPTETESKLDFIVQGPYRTTPNRSSIPADDEDNIMLAKETAILLRDSIIELKNSGILNMSFLRVLPLSKERFETFGLYMPLYETIKDLFKTTAIIPSKSRKYVHPKYAKIARQEKLAAVFSDELLTQLINDGEDYCWLPTFLTETNKEYKHVLDYMTGVLNVPVIRPEDLRILFASNPDFLPSRDNDWIVELYGIFENIPAAFSKAKYEANMLTSEIIKTASGKFVAPFRREEKSYIPNVFLPSSKMRSDDINFVDIDLYQRCRLFFDGVLELKAPNEYEYTIKDIKKRYENGYQGDEDQHINDVKALFKYSKNDDYRDEVTGIIKDIFVIKCSDGKLRNAYSTRVFLPISTDGINIESYYRNIGQNVFFVDFEFYNSNGIDALALDVFGVKNSIVIDENIFSGSYETGSRGKQPSWWTTGDFCWKLSIDALKDVLKYISAHPTAKDTMLKSKVIMQVLFLNEKHLCGTVNICGSTPNLENELCEMLHILRGERIHGWDGKWLFTESGELVAPKTISKHDMSTFIYGRMDPNSIIFDLLGFKKTEEDEIDDLEKTVPEEQLDAYFKRKLWLKYGITPDDLEKQYGDTTVSVIGYEDMNLPFPTLNIKNWDALKKHAAEMLIYANPVKYEERVRSIRISNRPREVKAYLTNMYRYDGAYKYACQLCHETCSSFETTELFLEPGKELDPINLCLCPNCAAIYRKFRSDKYLMREIRNDILSKTEQEIQSEDHVTVEIDENNELWFTQTHFAEVRELIKLADEAESSKSEHIQPTEDDEDEKSGMSVYSAYIGKTIRRKDGFVGIVKDVTMSDNDDYLVVNVTGGKDAGKDTRIQLAFILKNRNVYSFSDQ